MQWGAQRIPSDNLYPKQSTEGYGLKGVRLYRTTVRLLVLHVPDMIKTFTYCLSELGYDFYGDRCYPCPVFMR